MIPIARNNLSQGSVDKKRSPIKADLAACLVYYSASPGLTNTIKRENGSVKSGHNPPSLLIEGEFYRREWKAGEFSMPLFLTICNARNKEKRHIRTTEILAESTSFNFLKNITQHIR